MTFALAEREGIPMQNLPPPVKSGVEDALAHLGVDHQLRGLSAVTGGCINHGARVDTADASFFLKWNASAPPHFFEAEADGLRALGAPDVLRVPTPLAHGGGSGAPAWFLMEYIEGGHPSASYEEALGRGLAAIHTSAAAEQDFGWQRDNWIGSLPQSNESGDSWADFWRDKRLIPQLTRSRERGFFSDSAGTILDKVVERVPVALADVDRQPPHLLHGDLWGGNAYPMVDGTPTLIDPAVYRGHGEVDLAMTELFGGFGARFYDGYREVNGISEAYATYRRDLYQLYYLLVHVNLFGSQYESPTLAAAHRVVAALKG